MVFVRCAPVLLLFEYSFVSKDLSSKKASGIELGNNLKFGPSAHDMQKEMPMHGMPLSAWCQIC